MTLYSRDITQQRRKLIGSQYNPTREFPQSLANRRRLLVPVKKLGPFNPAALKPSGYPRSPRKSSGP
jgi:hypothetical protein